LDVNFIELAANPLLPKLLVFAALLSSNKPIIFGSVSPVEQNEIISNFNLQTAINGASTTPKFFNKESVPYQKKSKEFIVDGGLFHCNPTKTTCDIARIMWPRTKCDIVLSFGQGLPVKLPRIPDTYSITEANHLGYLCDMVHLKMNTSDNNYNYKRFAPVIKNYTKMDCRDYEQIHQLVNNYCHVHRKDFESWAHILFAKIFYVAEDIFVNFEGERVSTSPIVIKSRTLKRDVKSHTFDVQIKSLGTEKNLDCHTHVVYTDNSLVYHIKLPPGHSYELNILLCINQEKTPISNMPMRFKEIR